MTNYNNCIEKDPFLGAALRPLFGYGMIFDQATDQWKAKRKHCAHAFYKSHMHDMQENLKKIVSQTFKEWLIEIEKSPNA